MRIRETLPDLARLDDGKMKRRLVRKPPPRKIRPKLFVKSLAEPHDFQQVLTRSPFMNRRTPKHTCSKINEFGNINVGKSGSGVDRELLILILHRSRRKGVI